MATAIFPSANNVGGGQLMSEANLASMYSKFVESYVVSGFAAPASSVNLHLTIPTGQALISGYGVITDASLDALCTASTTNHIYLQLTFDGSSHVTGIQTVVNTTGVAPSNSVKIATAIADGDNVTSTLDARQVGIAASPHVITLLQSETALSTTILTSSGGLVVTGGSIIWDSALAVGRGVYISALLQRASSGTASLWLESGMAVLAANSSITKTTDNSIAWVTGTSPIPLTHGTLYRVGFGTSTAASAANVWGVRLIIK